MNQEQLTIIIQVLFIKKLKPKNLPSKIERFFIVNSLGVLLITVVSSRRTVCAGADQLAYGERLARRQEV